MASIFKRLVEQQVVLPYLENAFKQDQWPDRYTIEVDSTPYYGLMDEEGISHEVGSGDGYFHPSTHPFMTARELWYRFHPEFSKRLIPERRTLAGHLTLAAGSAMHSVIQTQLNMAKILRRGKDSLLDEWTEHRPGVRGMWPERNPYEWEYINSAHNLRGRSDGILDHPLLGDMTFELKTQNSRAYRFQETWKDEWYGQTQCGMDAYGVDEGVILVLEMGYPFDMKEFRVRRDVDFLDRTWEKFAYVRDCLARDVPPRCEHPLDSDLARSCAARALCWED